MTGRRHPWRPSWRWRTAAVPWLVPAAWAWVTWQQRRVRRQGRPLDPGSLALARQVGVREPERVRVLVLPAMPVPGQALWHLLGRRWHLPWHGVDAITLGHAVLCIGRPPGAELLAHELRHVQQCERAGSLRAFLAEYLRQVALHGYRDAPYEVDARAAAAAVTAAPGAAGLTPSSLAGRSA